MNWHGYIKGDGTCLITPLLPNAADVLQWWAGSVGATVRGDGLEDTKTMAGKHGAKRFVLHNPPDVKMTRI